MMNQKTKINCKEGAFYQTLGTRIFGFLFVCSFVLISTACSSGAAGTSIDSGEDTDKDGIADSMDSCPNDANEGIDTDEDGIDDVCDRDDDNDEVFDDEDNCKKIYNPIRPDETTQRDTDRDEIGDECDDDSTAPQEGCSDEMVNNCTLTNADEGVSQAGTCPNAAGSCNYTCEDGQWVEPTTGLDNTCTAPQEGCSDEVVAHCTLTTANEGDSQAGTCPNTADSCNYTCKDGQWEEPSTGLDNSCTPRCIDEVVDNCTLTNADEGDSQAGTCPNGYTGSCNYTCENGQWVEPTTGLDNSCTPRCIDEVVNNCTLTNADDGVNQDGACPTGYTGSCSYTCDGGQWVDDPITGLDNSCTPRCIDEVVNNCTLTNADDGVSQDGNCPTGYIGSCNYTCENGQWVEPSAGLDNTCTPGCSDEVVDNCTLTTAPEGSSKAGTCTSSSAECAYRCSTTGWVAVLMCPSSDTDNDGIADFADTCLQSPNGFISDKGPRDDGQQSNDYDNDGCQDATEDFDDDNDKIDDDDDLCQLSTNLGFLSDKGPRSDDQPSNDYDSDGCEDTTEDVDDDGDGLIEIGDEIRAGVSAEDMLKNIRWNLAGTSYDDEEEDTGTVADTGDDSGCPSDACNGYELMHDITLSTNWEPVGTKTTPFTGNFDGNGNTIQNFNINTTVNHAGFFGVLVGTRIKPILVQNLRLSGTSVQSSYSGDEYIAIGVLAGIALIHSYEATVIDNVSSLGISVIGGSKGYAIGGLVGGILGGIIQNSYSTGDVNGATALTDDEGAVVGGLVGINHGGTIRNSYATGDVNGGADDDYVGGLVGINAEDDGLNGVVQNSYATGNVNGGAGSDLVGGLIGLNDGNTLVEYCYATKSDTSNSLLGSTDWNDITITIQYNYRITGLGSGNNAVRKLTDLTLKALTSTQTKTDFGTAGGWKTKNWDFTDTSKYPTLKLYKEDDDGDQIEGGLLCGQGTDFVQCASQ